MIVSHSVFKDQKKHQRFFSPPQQAFFVGAASNLRKLLQSVNRFFKLFSEQFSCSIPTRLSARFVSNKAGHHTHISLLGNPFFKLSSEQFSHSILTRFTARFVLNKAGDSTHIKKPCNFFLDKNATCQLKHNKTPINRHKIPPVMSAKSVIIPSKQPDTQQ